MFYWLTYATFISVLRFLLGFQKYLIVNHTYQNRGNHLNALTFRNIINIFFKIRWNMNTRDSYFPYKLEEFKSIYQQTTYQNRRNHLDCIFQNESNMKVWGSYFHIYNMSSKNFLSKPHTKTEESTWTWVSYILKEFHFLEVLPLWLCWITKEKIFFFT